MIFNSDHWPQARRAQHAAPLQERGSGDARVRTTADYGRGAPIWTNAFGGVGGAWVQRGEWLGRFCRRFRSLPIPTEVRTKCPTLSGPTTLTLRIQCRPLLAAQPHWEQSGLPPKTHGSTRVSKSAE